MATELECKLRVENLREIQRRLHESGAEFIGRVLETNRIYDREDGSLRKAGCGLRIRTISVLEGNGPGATFTFKGPRVEGAFKQREELETTIEAPQTMMRILAALGYREKTVFEKRRESWRSHNCCVELDEVAQLGTFVEIEGPSESEITAAINRLGLDSHAPIREGYAALLAQRSDHLAAPQVRYGFD